MLKRRQFARGDSWTIRIAKQWPNGIEDPQELEARTHYTVELHQNNEPTRKVRTETERQMFDFAKIARRRLRRGVDTDSIISELRRKKKTTDKI